MQRMLHDMPSSDTTLTCTAYVTWGAALLGMHDASGADHMLKEAVDTKPTSAIAWDFWAEVKRQKGDATEADLFHQRALGASDHFENYAEVAALYFQLAWRDNQPVMRSNFVNPANVSFH
jgi:Tfp pilus assembly protein PilF